MTPPQFAALLGFLFVAARGWGRVRQCRPVPDRRRRVHARQRVLPRRARPRRDPGARLRLTASGRWSRALIIVDVQRDFLPGGPLGVPDGDAVIVARSTSSPATAASTSCSRLALTATRATTPRFRAQGGPWPPHCVQGTPGAELAPELEHERIDAVIDKGATREGEGYSGFETGERGTLLRTERVTAITLTGLGDRLLRRRDRARCPARGLPGDDRPARRCAGRRRGVRARARRARRLGRRAQLADLPLTPRRWTVVAACAASVAPNHSPVAGSRAPAATVTATVAAGQREEHRRAERVHDEAAGRAPTPGRSRASRASSTPASRPSALGGAQRWKAVIVSTLLKPFSTPKPATSTADRDGRRRHRARPASRRLAQEPGARRRGPLAAAELPGEQWSPAARRRRTRRRGPVTARARVQRAVHQRGQRHLALSARGRSWRRE